MLYVTILRLEPYMIGEKNDRNTASTGSRALSIGAGALAIALSITIIVSPLFGIALLVYGIRLVVTGTSGRKGEEAVKSTLS